MTTTTIRPLSERVKGIKLVDDDDSGLINDPAAAVLPELQLPPFNPQWRNPVKIAWFMVFEAINKNEEI